MPATAAATIAVIGSTILLPPYLLSIPSLPDYSKATAASIGLLLSLFIFDSNRLMRLRPLV